MRTLRLTPLLLLVAAPALADDRVSESRSVSGFARIELIAPLDVVVRPGKFSCTVNTERSIAAMLRTEVSGDTLRIVLDGRHLTMHGPQKHVIQITMPEFRGVHIQGSGDADISGFNQSGEVEIRIEGSGDVRYSGTSGALSVNVQGSGDVALADGQAAALNVNIDGSGDLKASGFKSKNVSVAVNGSGDADVQVTGGAIQLAVNGSGDIRWSGEASAVSAVTHGSGSIRKR
jgi:hypothetical protein